MAWSFSSLMNYEACPYRRALQLQGFKQSYSAQATRGVDIHAQTEGFLLHKDECPDTPHAEEIRLIRTHPNLMVEQEWAFTDQWEPTDYDYRTAWLVMKLDAVSPTTSTIYDWKTGKKSPVKHAMQAQLYAIGAYHQLDIEPIVRFLYLDTGEYLQMGFKVSQLQTLQGRWHARADKMLNDQRLNPKPNAQNCKFCPYQKDCDYRVTT